MQQVLACVIHIKWARRNARIRQDAKRSILVQDLVIPVDLCTQVDTEDPLSLRLADTVVQVVFPLRQWKYIERVIAVPPWNGA